MFKINFSALSAEEILLSANEKLNEGAVDWEKNIWSFLVEWFSDSDAIAVTTSGSTGVPKQILHRKEHMLNSARMTCDALQLEKDDVALLCLPATKISGMMMLVRSIYCQMNLVCIEPSVTPMQDIDEEQVIDFAAFTPMQFASALLEEAVTERTGKISKIILGGEKINTQLLLRIAEMKNEVYATFGMTETISHIALRKLNGSNKSNTYVTLPGIEVATNEQNQLIIMAPTLGQPNLLTNDEVNIISENEFEWLGRTDNVINSGGVKLHAEEIEAQLQPTTDYKIFITALPDEFTGEQVALAIEKEALTEGEIQEWKDTFAALEKICRPKTILLIEKFARTENGKLNRKESLKKVMLQIACT